MARTYRIGTRTSPLALKQTEEVLDALGGFYPAVEMKIAGIDTYGDRDKSTPISAMEGTDFFTREIDEALLKDEIDFAVHSAKDLPDKPVKGMVIAAITHSIDPYDVLVSREGLELAELPYEAKIGTSSMRRKAQLKQFRTDFQLADIRGNIEERLDLLDNNEIPLDFARGMRDLEAIVIAAAGLIRLGLAERITQKLPFEIMRPHPFQGALAVVAKEGDEKSLNLLSVLDTRRR